MASTENPHRELCNLFRLSLSARFKNPADLAKQLDMNPGTLNHLLHEGKGSLAMFLLVGTSIGLDPSYIAAQYGLDDLNALPSTSVPKSVVIQRTKSVLKADLQWSLPHRTQGRKHQLAFQRFRQRNRLHLEAVAKHLPPDIATGNPQIDGTLNTGTVEDKVKLLTKFECSQTQFSQALMTALQSASLAALQKKPSSSRSAQPLSLVSIKNEIERLVTALSMGDLVTESETQWLTLRGDRQFRGEGWFYGPPPRMSRHDEILRYAKLSTIFGAIEIEKFHARNARELSRSTIRILANGGHGLEIAIMVRGRGLLTIAAPSTTFYREEPNEIPDFFNTSIYPNLLINQFVEAGDLVVIPANLSHRIEFLGRENLAVAINITRNVELSRRDVFNECLPNS